MNDKLKNSLASLACGIFLIIVRLKGDSLIDSTFPEHIIGKSGLLSVRTYLITYIVVRIICAISVIAVLTTIIRVFGMKHFGMSKAGQTAAIVITFLAGGMFFLGDKCNELDVHSQMKNYSKNGLIKSISLLSDVNSDLKSESSVKKKYSYLTVTSKQYRYGTGRSRGTRTEKVIAGHESKTICQIGSKDSVVFDIIFYAASDELPMETYTQSGFVKSVAGIDDFSKFSLTEKDYEKLSILVK